MFFFVGGKRHYLIQKIPHNLRMHVPATSSTVNETDTVLKIMQLHMTGVALFSPNHLTLFDFHQSVVRLRVRILAARTVFTYLEIYDSYKRNIV